LVVRITNTDVICQIVYAKIQGDLVLASAYAHELPRYGIKHGLTNYSACYATGLLVARRLLTKLGLADKYEGQAEPTGELFNVEDLEDGPAAFKCFLDVGLRRTSTGARIFAAMKGAADGGLNVPHNEKRFPGYDSSSKELDAEVMRGYIFGEHVAEYMRYLQEEDPEKYKVQFARYVADEIGPDDLEDLYAEAHSAIREDPSAQPTEKKDKASYKKRRGKLNLKQRKDRVKQKKETFARKIAAAAQ
jgi:large subunit ribosomal protein L5e